MAHLLRTRQEYAQAPVFVATYELWEVEKLSSCLKSVSSTVKWKY